MAPLAAAFRSSVNTSSSGHTLDFSGLDFRYAVNLNLKTGEMTISNGSTTFAVGDAPAGGGHDATPGGSAEFSNFDEIYGNQGDDTITGTSGAQEIWGEGGGDRIDGGGGNDSLYFGTGSDTVLGGDGDDRVFTGGGSDTIYGEAGKDRLFGGNGSDSQSPWGRAMTTFMARAAATRLRGQGDDMLGGEWGADQFVFGDAYGADTIADFSRGSDSVPGNRYWTRASENSHLLRLQRRSGKPADP